MSVSSYVRSSHSSASSSGPGGTNFYTKVRQPRNGRAVATTHVNFAQELGDRDDVILQEVVQNDHVSFLAEQDVIGKVLDDLRDDHETTANSGIGWKRNIDSLWRDDSRRDEPSIRMS